MKKSAIPAIVILISSVAVLAAPKIKEVESVISKSELKEKIGLIAIDFKIPDKSYYEFVMKKTREGIIEDVNKPIAVKNKEIAFLDSFKNERERCLMFRIRHSKPVHRTKGGVAIVFSDAMGKPVKYSLLDSVIKWSGDGTMYEQVFLIRPEKEINKENYGETLSPLKIAITFMNTQKKTYSIVPK